MALSTFVKEFFGTIKGVANAAGVDVFVAAETDGSLKNVLYGKDSSGNQDPLRTNADQQLQVEVVNAPPVQVDAVILTNAAAAVYNPGSTASEMYEVEFLVTNYTTTGVTINVGVDLGGGTTYDRSYFTAYPLPARENTGWQSLGRIAGDDDVVAHASTNTSAQIWFRVDQLA